MKQRAMCAPLKRPEPTMGSARAANQNAGDRAPPAVIVTTPQALATLVRDAVSQALADVHQDARPLLLDRASAARALGVGTSTVDRFRRAGMPCVFAGDAPRFILDECMAWVRQNRRTPTED